jgi:hypothetical protein
VRCEYDSIRVSGGVYLVDRLFGVLSTLHQSITLFKIDPISGKFSKITEIGQSLYEDDEFYLSAVPSGDPHTDKVFTG